MPRKKKQRGGDMVAQPSSLLKKIKDKVVQLKDLAKKYKIVSKGLSLAGYHGLASKAAQAGYGKKKRTVKKRK